MKPLTYLACPYSHPDPEVRASRFEAANRAAGALMALGEIVFSPISHTHPIALACELPWGWDFWETFDRAYLGVSRRLVVLMLEGWRESIGVQAELQIAEEFGIEIEFMEMSSGVPLCSCEAFEIDDIRKPSCAKHDDQPPGLPLEEAIRIARGNDPTLEEIESTIQFLNQKAVDHRCCPSLFRTGIRCTEFTGHAGVHFNGFLWWGDEIAKEFSEERA